ncbi:MAG: UvrD-helicase domain-containing protein [bacterium]|nr:UvrD-helicase domain-containing protein [bacterium]
MDFHHLNDRQKEAVLTTDGPLLIFAGAGSGKTRVLVHRIAHLLHEKKAQPWQIFAVTFTNKAAGEMRERVSEILSRRSDELWISTFHSAGVRVLRRHIERLGYGPTFAIYDDSDQIALLKQCMDELQVNAKIFHPRAVQSRIDSAKNELIDPHDFPTEDFFSERVAQIYELYNRRLRENNALDFGDLLVLPVKLFESFPEVLKDYTDRIRYFMVDEYQDTNHAHYRLIQLLAGPSQNLCVVGDDDQSIYRWRGADVRNILEFEKDFSQARVVKLEQNYRSTQNILRVAGEVVKKIQERAEKTLWTENPAGESIKLFSGQSDKDEAAFVVQTLQDLQEEGYALSDFAIFYRTNAQSRVFEDELRRHNIPYVIYGGVRFYDRMEIKDILAYLWVLANPQDSLHLKRIINVPTRGIGKTSIEKLERWAFEKGITLFEALSYAPEAGVSGKAAKQIVKFLQLIKNLKDALSKGPLSRFVQDLMEQTGYLEALRQEKTLEAEGRMENLEELVNVVEDYESSNSEASLAGFLDQVALVNSIDSLEEEGQALPLMTLHLAKGLEFEVVFFVGMEEGLLPHSRSLDTQEEVDEERRLTYVGMTRAKQRLYLCHAQRRRVFGNDQYHLPSRFLEDLPEDILEPIAPDRPELQWGEPDAESGFAMARPQDPDNPYRVGTKVRHPIFGLGTIKNCEGSVDNRKITVSFQGAGLKKLVAKMANLTILG